MGIRIVFIVIKPLNYSNGKHCTVFKAVVAALVGYKLKHIGCKVRISRVARKLLQAYKHNLISLVHCSFFGFSFNKVKLCFYTKCKVAALIGALNNHIEPLAIITIKGNLHKLVGVVGGFIGIALADYCAGFVIANHIHIGVFALGIDAPHIVIRDILCINLIIFLALCALDIDSVA